MNQRKLKCTANLIGFAVLFLLGLVNPLWGQDWNTPIELTHGYGHTTPYMAVDSSYRIHLFVVRSRDSRPGSGQPNTLVYYLFDNWGRPLRDAYELLPDSHWTDDGRIGLILDRQERVHVLWHRHYDSSPATQSLIYARLSSEGEFLQEPLILGRDTEPGNYHLIETLSGEVWGACGDQFFAVDVNGNLVEPLQYVYRPDSVRSANLMLGAAPDGSVWGCLMTIATLNDRLMTNRLWPPPRVEEITYMGGDTDANQAFNIDVNGAFHYVMYGDHRGLYYRFDSRTGRVEDSTVIDPNPVYIQNRSNLIPVSEDSLMFLTGRQRPQDGITRTCFTTDGTIGFGPSFILVPDFILAPWNAVWRDGGYWIPGETWDGTEAVLAMLHIPGLHEPLAVTTPPPVAAQSGVRVFPQPSVGTISFIIPPELKGEKQLTLYNLLGQQALQMSMNESPVAGQASITLPPTLANGLYFMSLSSPAQIRTSRFVLIR